MVVRFVIPLVAAIGFSSNALAAEACTAAKRKAVCEKDAVQKQVEKACALVEAKGKDAVAEIEKLRFDCCGDSNYVWINTTDEKKVMMVMHPVKKKLNNTEITGNKDPDGKALFVEFVKAVNKEPKGAWVDYKWTKLGETEPTPKTSWVKKCGVGKTGEFWVVGSGTWKE
jgi:signal transduction histidine kinase